MSDPHAGFIVAAYFVTFAVIGIVIGTIVLRHRALKRALARFNDNEPDAS